MPAAPAWRSFGWLHKIPVESHKARHSCMEANCTHVLAAVSMSCCIGSLLDTTTRCPGNAPFLTAAVSRLRVDLTTGSTVCTCAQLA